MASSITRGLVTAARALSGAIRAAVGVQQALEPLRYVQCGAPDISVIQRII